MCHHIRFVKVTLGIKKAALGAALAIGWYPSLVSGLNPPGEGSAGLDPATRHDRRVRESGLNGGEV